MWFKTRAGLVNVEGAAEFLAARGARRDGGTAVSVGVFRVQHGQFEVKRFFLPSINVTNPWMSLACFPDDGNVDDAVANCMQRIEDAIRNNDLVCDLSDLGDETCWGNPEQFVYVKWQSRGVDSRFRS